MATKSILTSYGNNKILEAIANETTVSISAIVYGDGNGSDYEPSVDQTALVHQIGRLTSIVKEFNPIDEFIYFKATIPASAEAFTLREFGLVDDTGALVSVTVVPSIEKPAASDGVSIALPISIGFKTSTGEIMVVVEDGTDVYANTSLSNLNNVGEHHFDTTYATIDLDNLSLEGERHFLGRTHITNCITEVAQRIKYTLEDGIFTLKAGSTIIVPYGIVDLSSEYPANSVFLNENFKVTTTQYVNNKFYVWAIVQSDMTTTFTTGAYHLSIFVDVTNNELLRFDRFTDKSGASLPTGSTASFFNTSSNKINRYSAGTIASEDLSFPVARITSTNTQIASVDETFNGITHMGTTIILDKDVRLLIPKGRNSNGSLNNEPFVTSNIIISSVSLQSNGISNGTYKFFYNYTDSTIVCYKEDFVFDSAPDDSLSFDRVYYDFSTNEFTQYISSTKYMKQYCQLGFLYVDTTHANSVATFTEKFAFRAMDYNDFVSINDKLKYIRNIGDPIITLSNNIEEDEVWLEGATVSRTSYAKLFALWGTTYGAGDGSTTFKLPDFRNRAIWGANSFGYLSAGLPNLYGWFQGASQAGNGSSCDGSLFKKRGAGVEVSNSGERDNTYTFNANAYNSIYGNSSTVQPPAIKVRVKTRYM